MTFLPDLPALLAFALASVILTITPGPDMTLFLGRTLAQGRAAGMAAMLGATSGVVVHTSLAAFGLSALIAASPEAFFALKVAGAGYLVFLAVQALRSGSALTLDESGTRQPVSLVRNWATGLGINLLNPKIVLFFVTFLPQFVSVRDPHAVEKLIFLGIFFILIATPMAVAMIFAAARFARFLKTRPRVMRAIDYVFASVFSAFAVQILLARS